MAKLKTNKTILLINSYSPPSFGLENRYVPLGLMYLAAALIEEGYAVKLKDIQNETLELNENEIDNYLNDIFIPYLRVTNPDFVGIGALFSSRFKPALKIAQTVKTVFENIPITFGGAHATLFPKEILTEYDYIDYIDYIVIGEGERSIVNLLNKHFNDKQKFSDIDGIAYRQDGRVIVSPKVQYIEDLDSLPFPAYEVINIDDYYFDTSDWHNPKKLSFNYNFPLITSRGCPKRCTYCALRVIHGIRYRMRSARNVVDEIQYLYNKYNCRYISFVDDNMTVSKKRALEIMSGIKQRNLTIQFDCSNGLDINTLDEELMDAMTEAGLVRTALGIESGSEYIRNMILKKHLTNKTIYNFFDMAQKYKDLLFVGYFMCGFPQETRETLNDTFKMIKKLPFDDVGLYFMTPFYGTEMFQYCYEQGLLDVDMGNLHNMSDFSYNAAFFVKPFKLDVAYLRDFREKITTYVRRRKHARRSRCRTSE